MARALISAGARVHDGDLDQPPDAVGAGEALEVVRDRDGALPVAARPADLPRLGHFLGVFGIEP
jgi:hypothetical protein